MLGLGWGEMLVIAVVLLIAVGPKDLPVLLRNLGKMMGSVRRMSNEFRREIDKAIAADEFKEAKKAISDPLKETTAEITREFNAIRKDGTVEPTGKIKPAEPGKESVFDEIRAQAGMTPPAAEPSKAAAAMRAQVQARNVKAATPAASVADAPKAAASKATAKKPAAKKAPAAKTAKAAESAPAKAAAPKKAPAAKAAKAAEAEPAPAKVIAPKKKAPARKKAAKPAEAEAGKE